MGFFKSLFSNTESNQPIDAISSYREFWTWFASREREFHKVVRERGDFEGDFFNHLSPRLAQINEGLFPLSGMLDEKTAELIITPDGNIQNIVFAEELVAAAPQINGWKFTALKPEEGKEFNLRKGDLEIGTSNLGFCVTETWERSDEVDIAVVHEAVTAENRDEMAHAIYLFLDNYLGELNFATQIDYLEIIGTGEATSELRPISSIKDYLKERHDSFREKYNGSRANTDEDSYGAFEAQRQDGLPLIAIMNTTLLMWDSKASHPWIALMELGFRGGQNGLPDDDIYQQLSLVEDEMMEKMRDTDGYLNVGH